MMRGIVHEDRVCCFKSDHRTELCVSLEGPYRSFNVLETPHILVHESAATITAYKTSPTSWSLLLHHQLSSFLPKDKKSQFMRLRLFFFFFFQKIIVNRRMFRAFYRLPSRPSKTLRTLQENRSIFLDERTLSSCSCYKILNRETSFLHLRFPQKKNKNLRHNLWRRCRLPKHLHTSWCACSGLFFFFQYSISKFTMKWLEASRRVWHGGNQLQNISSWVHELEDGRVQQTCSSSLSCNCVINRMGNGSRSRSNSSNGI